MQLYEDFMRRAESFREINDNRSGLKGMFAFFNEQVRSVALAHRLSNEIRTLSKEGIALLKQGADKPKLGEIKKKMENLLMDLNRLNLPADTLWKFVAEASQEYVEYIYVCLWWFYIRDGGEAPSVTPDSDELCVTPQAWLAGLVDVPGELGKLFTDEALSLSSDQQKGILKRLIAVCEDIYKFLDKFETITPQIVENNRYKGYGNTLRGALGRIRGQIQRHKQQLISFQNNGF